MRTFQYVIYIRKYTRQNIIHKNIVNGNLSIENVKKSTAVGQAVACAPVTQRARVRSPVGTGFLGEVFLGFFLACKINVRKL